MVLGRNTQESGEQELLSIFITGKNLKEMSNLMTDQMKRVSDWLKNNLLTLNVSKTNYMIMCNRGKNVADAECNIEIAGKNN